jgi:CRISPR-associated protein Csd1
MMIQALMAYSEREGFDPDFETASVRWRIPIDSQGKWLGSVIPLLEDPAAKRFSPKRLLRPFSRSDDVGHGQAYFLCDNLERSLTLPVADNKAKTESRKVNFAFFKGLLREAAAECPEEAGRLNALLTFLDDQGQLERVHQALTDAGCKTTENADFEVGGETLLTSASLRAWWRRKREATRKHARGGLVMSLASGEMVVPVATTGKVKGIRGSPPAGANLISFDKDSFTSFGLDQALNAPISFSEDAKITGALNKLIKRGYRVENAVYLHWTRDPDKDPFDLLETPDEAAVAELLQSPLKGKPPGGLAANKYYLLSLSGNGGRIVVRDWLESTVPEVEANVRDWFEHLTIAKERDGGIKSAFGLYALLSTIVPSKKQKPDFEKLPPQLAAQLLRAALSGSARPSALLGAAVSRQNSGGEYKLNPARLALIKLCIVRNHSTDPRERKTMSDHLKQLDPDSTDIAYLCGQLFAVIGRLQRVALGKVGSSLVERTYGGVATRPASTLGPVFTKVPAYLKKANSRFPGAGTNKQKEIEALCARIDAVNKGEGRLGFPPLLDLEEQGRFALGYYCQLAQYRADRRETEIEEEAERLPEDVG